ncbi:hypothetical protein [Paenibacillus xylanexedens]|uniref:hypothetical protein n=1 Tax=Paenibacillus xylanexedens TaxID=528191 RepID=UPI00119D1A34|nr:hypothetical protein [Paenibacillus xylanexedens]
MDYPKNIELSTHAFERMQERFPEYSKNKKMATDYIRSLMKQTKYVGLVPDKCGVDSHMYVFNKNIAIHLALDSNIITTIYIIERDNREHIGFRDKVEDLYKKEFKKIHKLELSKRKKNVFSKAKNEAEIAALKYKSLITRSHNVKIQCEKRILELENEISVEENEVKNLQIQKRHIAYAIATNNF